MLPPAQLKSLFPLPSLTNLCSRPESFHYFPMTVHLRLLLLVVLVLISFPPPVLPLSPLSPPKTLAGSILPLPPILLRREQDLTLIVPELRGEADRLLGGTPDNPKKLTPKALLSRAAFTPISSGKWSSAVLSGSLLLLEPALNNALPRSTPFLLAYAVTFLPFLPIVLSVARPDLIPKALAGFRFRYSKRSRYVRANLVKAHRFCSHRFCSEDSRRKFLLRSCTRYFLSTKNPTAALSAVRRFLSPRRRLTA